MEEKLNEIEATNQRKIQELQEELQKERESQQNSNSLLRESEQTFQDEKNSLLLKIEEVTKK
jgi:FtsZ-binding cell division protein ZapB